MARLDSLYSLRNVLASAVSDDADDIVMWSDFSKFRKVEEAQDEAADSPRI